MKRFITSEAVTEGHPDKICDKISDKILDAALASDKKSKMAVECSIKDNNVFIFGEARTKAKINYSEIAKWVLKDIGYNDEFNINVFVSDQSSEINNAVDGDIIKAGDQGIMFGYACKDTLELMPLPIFMANRLCEKIAEIRKKDKSSPMLPDGKCQVTVEYDDNAVKRIDTIIIASQHKKGISQTELKDYIIKNVIDSIVPKNLIDSDTKILINTSGSFTIGGPFGDSGTTGRKIVVDSYGGSAKVGGGCYSSKDPSKVDRSAAYYARYVAKNVVYNNLSDICEISVSYSIGLNNPISINIETFGTNNVPIDKIYDFVNKNFDFSVNNIINELGLLDISYYDLASYGHFGRSNYPWENIKKIS